MKSLNAILILFLMQWNTAFGQMIDNQIFKKIRNESYDNAIKYGNRKLSKLSDSSKYYKKAIPYHLGLGIVYRKTGNFGEAEKQYAKALKVLEYKEDHGMRRKIVDYDVYDELGLMYLETGNFEEAEDLIKEGIAARKKRFSSTNLLRYRSYMVYGNYFFKTGQSDSAYFYFKKYIFYIKNSRHTSKEELNRYADTYMQLARMELKRGNATQALLFARKNKHLQFHRWTKKEAGRNNVNKIISLNLLSECYRVLGDYRLASHYNKNAFNHYNRVIKSETYDMVPLLMNRGFIYWDQGKIDKAEKDFVKAAMLQAEFVDKNFKSLSEYEKENFYASIKENFDLLNAFAVDKFSKTRNQKDTIWKVIYDFQIKTKAIILNESNRILEVIHNSKDQQLIDQFNEWRKYKNELAKKIVVEGLNENDRSIREIKYTINRLEKEMSEKTSLFGDSTKEIFWQDVRNKLQPGEAAVEVIRAKVYSEIPLKNKKIKTLKKFADTSKGLSDSIAYVYLILTHGADSPEAVINFDGKKLDNKHYKYYRNAQVFRLNDLVSYNVYWQPLNDKLKSSSTVYVSSDGIYNLVNLSILKNPESNRFLIDDVKIVNLTNTKQILSKSIQQEVNKSSILLIGRPNYSKVDSSHHQQSTGNGSNHNYFRGGVEDLPGTELEVKKIDDFLSKNAIDSKVLLWDEASEDHLKKTGSRHIMHIATHGYFDVHHPGQNPMLRSGLLLAGVSGKTAHEDGLLTAYEASTLDLNNTSLVVLSACETGLGEIKNGEGVYGLQRAFEVAGVDAILMSMWKVNDQTTQELMVIFYDELLQKKSVLDAFKNAQLRIRAKYPETLYWGAFKLIGQ